MIYIKKFKNNCNKHLEVDKLSKIYYNILEQGQLIVQIYHMFHKLSLLSHYKIKVFLLKHNLSIFTAEILANHISLKYILKQLHPNIHRFIICTNSRSALEKIRKPGNKFDLVIQWILKLLAELKAAETIVNLLWMKGYAGVTGNDMADLCAKKAVEEGIPIEITTRRDLKNAATRRMKMEWQRTQLT